MSNSVMDPYQLRRGNFPITLYRVHYPGSRTAFSRQLGFSSASGFTPHRIKGLIKAVTYHINWQCNRSSPFISTFSNQEHALNWARTWEANHNYEPCEIVELRIIASDGVTVFCLANLVNELDITTTLASSQYRSEYLCLHHIPATAIMRIDPVSYVEFSLYGRASDWASDDD